MTGAPGPLSFGDRVAEAVAARGSQLVLGLDPDPAQLWPAAMRPQDGEGRGAADPRDADRRGEADPRDADPRDAEADAGAAADPAAADPRTAAARAVIEHCRLVIDATAEQCVAAKLQVACFERLGAPGWSALGRVAQYARERGLLVIADAKRGDIDVSAAAYAQAFFGETATPFGPVAGLGVDALTVNPLLGADSLVPLLASARRGAAGLFVLVRTSNPGAADIQELALADGGSVSERLAAIVASAGADGVGSSGLSDVGAVVGATAPGWIGRLRELMPSAVFLLPGVGPQGGSVDGLGPAFAPGRAGGLITASRAIVHAHRDGGGEPAAAARSAAARLRELAWHVSGG